MQSIFAHVHHWNNMQPPNAELVFSVFSFLFAYPSSFLIRIICHLLFLTSFLLPPPSLPLPLSLSFYFSLSLSFSPFPHFSDPPAYFTRPLAFLLLSCRALSRQWFAIHSLVFLKAHKFSLVPLHTSCLNMI